MSRVPRLRSPIVAALLLGSSIAGCRQTSMALAPSPPTGQHQVAVTVEDSTGARVAGAYVVPFGIDAATGGHNPNPSLTDAAGVASFTLVDGHWSTFARDEPANAAILVAGSTGMVGPRPAPDTVCFRLVLRTQSIAHGTITLDGQTDYSGTLAGVLGVPTFTQTTADGSYELVGFPPGSWTTFVSHQGFQPAQFTLTVPAPGDTVDAGTVALPPAPVTMVRR